MSSELFLKDIGEIHSRLFDHRPVVRGEISYFLKEFEDKRNDRETKRLQKSLEYAMELNSILIPSGVEMLEKNIPELKAKVVTACEMTRIILERESDDKSQQTQEMTSQHHTRQMQDWSTFMDTMCEKSAAVDAKFEHEVKLLNAYYGDLEEKLKKTRPTT
ncbi:Biogenesis of lysosome-related organelles complex 1 subunit 5 [Lamellibrachia satsuma]|nr:Biogenesis of lysosome-related organelles complex 1 subunit 5 [Lamellibrachia satsuma]